jgi:FkbM family methyltransferase
MSASEARVSTPNGGFRAMAGDLITNQLVDFGAHTRNELAMVLEHIGEADVCVDIGAHIGTYAIPIAQKLGPKGRLLAVEGSGAIYELLQANVCENGLIHKIETVQAIVGDGSGRRLRRVDVEGNTGAGYYVGDEQADLAALDAYALLCAKGFARPDFIKVDIEGMELVALRSLAPLVSRHRPKLYIEVVAEQLARFGASLADLQAYLSEFDYRFYRNTGERNSSNDRFEKTELRNLEDGGGFFDLLALPA